MMDRGILLVDDEELILSSLGRELRPWLESRGLVCFQARSGAEALALLTERHEQVLVLVTDLRMPVMSGDKLVSEVRLRWPTIEAILISGYAEMQGLSRAIAAGIRGFVPKPWDSQTLTRELDKALDEQARIKKEAAVRNHLTDHLSRTRDIQRTLFRNDLLDAQKFRLSMIYRPLAEQFCGGDFYEIVRLSEDRCVVLVGDVGGHGSEAAFITGVLHTLIAQDEIFNLLSGSASPGYLLSRLNGLVFDHLVTEDSRTVALTVLLFDRGAGVVQVANAGGLPLIRVRDGEGSALHVQGFPLGLAADTAYRVHSMDLKSGDRWVLMTDGLVDRGRAGFLSSEEVVRRVTDGFAQWEGDGTGLHDIVESFQSQFVDRKFIDDLTLLAVEIV